MRKFVQSLSMRKVCPCDKTNGVEISIVAMNISYQVSIPHMDNQLAKTLYGHQS
jgi:hypothetical protein